jgi:hypothetical protein
MANYDGRPFADARRFLMPAKQKSRALVPGTAKTGCAAFDESGDAVAVALGEDARPYGTTPGHARACHVYS